jgi:1-acyl-sn-glycerol-3-phosphate acyltransferase
MTTEQRAPGPLRYHFVRLVLKIVCSAYVRTSVSDAERIPVTGPYIICFNHPSWLDPIFFAGFWPDSRRDLYIFGPREQDMSTGFRNRVITWTRRGVPFQPRAQDVIDTTRRTVAVLKGGSCVAVAGEGRLSDHEGQILPLETGLAHFARLANAPILPVAIVGSRWVSLGSRISLRIGDAVYPQPFGRGKKGARAMTDEVAASLQALLAGVEEREPPGRFGRTN